MSSGASKAEAREGIARCGLREVSPRVAKRLWLSMGLLAQDVNTLERAPARCFARISRLRRSIRSLRRLLQSLTLFHPSSDGPVQARPAMLQACSEPDEP